MTSSETRTEQLSIGEVAERTGLSVHALRLYEREGLLIAPVRRNTGGRRRYTTADLEWLLICVRLRESGMPLAELKRFAELVQDGPGNEADRLQLLNAHQKRVEARIRELEECHSVIAWKVGVYSEHLARGAAGGLWDPQG
ncbi:MerR family transcriptional regulator [Streptomyces sp. NPDC002690]